MNPLVLTLDPEVLATVQERLRRHKEDRAKYVRPLQLDISQRHALQWFRDGRLPCEQPNVTLRRVFDLVRLGLVEKVDGRYHLTPTGRAVLAVQS